MSHFRQEDISQHHSPRRKRKVRKYIKQMALKLPGNKYLGKIPSWWAISKQCLYGKLMFRNYSKPKASLLSPHSEKYFQDFQYEAELDKVSLQGGGVSSWPKAVQHLLSNCSRSSRISSAIAELGAVFYRNIETDRELATKLNQAVCRCGAVHRLQEVCILYIDSLHPTTRKMVAQYWESHLRTTYRDVEDFGQHKRNHYVLAGWHLNHVA